MLGEHITATLIVAAGIAVIMTASDTAMLALTLTGVGHMVWLGIQTLREAPSAQVKMNVAQHPPAHPSHGHQSTKPQDLLAFLALLPHFTRQAAAPPVSAQILVFGVIHIIGCAAVYLAGEYGEATALANRPKVAITVRILSGIGLGIEQTITT
ncbi:LysE family transporter [Corynebacterium stationis]|uniref:LysE family transporter n=1 Tax=Corynebacterium stationis TaxID=1705 RepID=UPI00095343A9|nr:LysE family transporter [Corynebacterium stationis]